MGPAEVAPLPALRTALSHARGVGYGWVPRALRTTSVDALTAEVEGRDFTPLPDEVGQVRQGAEELVVAVGDPDLPVMAQLARALCHAVVIAGSDLGFGRYRPQEATYLRYRGPGAGISPHRDARQYLLLVAIFTLVGQAPFRVVADRAGRDVLASWLTLPGDLCLLRAPRVGGEAEGRPLHAVGPPLDSERLSLAFRMSGY
ncbi:MAG TPA: hypothetical protein VG034_25650 [Acidimicrobiia bacterium]|nr:hypothetical protein [Acidimicrobiia bacterium]